jgi:hypothetical protein
VGGVHEKAFSPEGGGLKVEGDVRCVGGLVAVWEGVKAAERCLPLNALAGVLRVH